MENQILKSLRAIPASKMTTLTQEPETDRVFRYTISILESTPIQLKNKARVAISFYITMEIVKKVIRTSKKFLRKRSTTTEYVLYDPRTPRSWKIEVLPSFAYDMLKNEQKLNMDNRVRIPESIFLTDQKLGSSPTKEAGFFNALLCGLQEKGCVVVKPEKNLVELFSTVRKCITAYEESFALQIKP